MQKLIFEEDGGEDLVAGRTEWSGISSDTGKNVKLEGSIPGSLWGFSLRERELLLGWRRLIGFLAGKLFLVRFLWTLRVC